MYYAPSENIKLDYESNNDIPSVTQGGAVHAVVEEPAEWVLQEEH